MDMTLSEALYAYEVLVKQGKYFISELYSKDNADVDRKILKKFGYHNIYLVDTKKRIRKLVSKYNQYHSILMQSVYLDKFYDVIPRNSALAPIKLFLYPSLIFSRTAQPIPFAFMWNMFDSDKSVEIFTRIISKEHGVPYDRGLSMEFERQIIEASMIECDFALLVEMLSERNKISHTFHSRFNIVVTLDVPIEANKTLNLGPISWNMLNSDWEANELINNIVGDMDINKDHLQLVLYTFKTEIINKKKEMIYRYSSRLFKYSRKHNLRIPFICKRGSSNVYEDKPFLLSQTINFPSKIRNLFQSSYKERLQICSKPYI
ncbi:uncharacterized protein TA11645 [Theileria annulata]|uniref:Uncharacterized protein n=1 Tax=Theileria annulata TaxID=5874 RepID=Q4UD88_THEAN|nr:uncharacterized protein TA11645 [Theileria annulata]CAI74951.1 hypothetical protein TA11645 [Theileria annulata]|eukprot:XP_952683.1 hypothetical protein TA11645 [Theileria annulata]